MENNRFVVLAMLSMAALAASPALAAVKPHSKSRVKPAAAHKLVALTPAQLARLVLPSVVRLTVLDASGQPSVQGSGFVVGPNLIATNLHVVSQSHAVTANFQNGRSETVYGFVTVDIARDLVLLYANTNGVRALPLMTDSTVQVGDPVVAVGSPEGYSGSMSTGIISQIRREGDTKYLQTTAPISHGSSGGALVDMYGRVLGITSFFNKDGQNLNFAYASYYLQQLIPHSIPVYTSWAQLELAVKEAKEHPAQVAATAPPAPETPAPASPATFDAADTAKFTITPLTGLKGVAVAVEDVNADVKAAGVDIDKLKSNTELRLRNAGVTVYDSPLSAENSTSDYLYVNINTIKVTSDSYAFSIDVELTEDVRLTRDIPVTAFGRIWNKGGIGTVGVNNLASSISQDVESYVDEFIKDYSVQNPK